MPAFGTELLGPGRHGQLGEVVFDDAGDDRVAEFGQVGAVGPGRQVVPERGGRIQDRVPQIDDRHAMLRRNHGRCGVVLGELDVHRGDVEGVVPPEWGLRHAHRRGRPAPQYVEQGGVVDLVFRQFDGEARFALKAAPYVVDSDAEHRHVLPRLPRHDVTHDTQDVSGGRSAEAVVVDHLARTLTDSGLGADLINLLHDRVYVGVSAGSMVFARKLTRRLTAAFGEDDEFYQLAGRRAVSPFDLFDWFLVPHADRETWDPRVADRVGCPVYAVDDRSALRIIDDALDVVSEGWWQRDAPSAPAAHD